MKAPNGMHVLQLGKYYFPYMGGIETHLHALCNELKPHVSLDAVVCNSDFKTVSETIDGVPVTRCGRAFEAASVSLCPSMPLVLSRRDYSIIHFHFPHPMGVMSYLASKKPARHRVVITYHSDVVRQERLMKAYAPFMDLVMDRADAILCTSPNYLESSPVLARYRPKCRVVPYGIDLSLFEHTPTIEARASAIQRAYPGRILLSIGRLIYYKGFEYAIQAMRHVDAHLLIIGDGPLRSSLERLSKSLGVAERVHFLGNMHNREIAPYHYASDMFVFPSIVRSEAFGIVQLEAMACGRPVVNTSITGSGVPFVSRHEESGLTVAPKDPLALANAVNTLLRDPDRARRYGEAGRQRVAAEFEQGVMARRVLSVYRELASS